MGDLLVLMSAILLFSVAAATSFLLVSPVHRVASRYGWFDRPGHRKVHTKQVPRIGGVCVFAAMLIAVLVMLSIDAWGAFSWPGFPKFLLPMLLGCTILFLVGIWDDLRHLSIGAKLVGQMVAALPPVLWGFHFNQQAMPWASATGLEYWAPPLTFLWVLVVTNAWNFIDGLDGLSSGLAIIAAGTFATLLGIEGNFPPMLILLALLGGTMGFLPHNTHPATIFLGDSGSLSLGYVLAVTAVAGSLGEVVTWPVYVPLLVLGVPLADITLIVAKRLLESLGTMRRNRTESLLKRILYLRRVFEADQQHIHHRLLALGFSHRSTVSILCGFSLLLSILALTIA